MVQDIEQEHKNHDHDDKDPDSGGPTIVVDVKTEENDNGKSNPCNLGHLDRRNPHFLHCESGG